MCTGVLLTCGPMSPECFSATAHIQQLLVALVLVVEGVCWFRVAMEMSRDAAAIRDAALRRMAQHWARDSALDSAALYSPSTTDRLKADSGGFSTQSSNSLLNTPPEHVRQNPSPSLPALLPDEFANTKSFEGEIAPPTEQLPQGSTSAPLQPEQFMDDSLQTLFQESDIEPEEEIAEQEQPEIKRRPAAMLKTCMKRPAASHAVSKAPEKKQKKEAPAHSKPEQAKEPSASTGPDSAAGWYPDAERSFKDATGDWEASVLFVG